MSDDQKPLPVVGETRWFVPSDRRWRSPEWVTITKVGRKWAEFGNRGRFEIATGRVDNGGVGASSYVYPSREVYEEMVAIQDAWYALRRGLDFRPPTPGVTLAAILEARRLLGLEPG